MVKIPKIIGYRRQNGRVGIRNHVVILPVDDISNAACEAVARVIQGVLPLPHAYGRLQFGEDLELFFRTMIGTGANPNVAAAIVIGIEPGWTGRIVEGIASTGKPVAGFSIERQWGFEDHRGGFAEGAGICSGGFGAGAGRMLSGRGLPFGQMRRVGYDDRAGVLPDGGASGGLVGGVGGHGVVR